MAAKKTPVRKPVNKGKTTAAAPAAVAAPKRQPKNSSGAKAGLPELSPAQRLAAARAAAHKINTSFKSEVVIPAGEAHTNSFLRRPSGIMQLDVDCAGGLPAASFNTISGPDNSGKSTLLYCYFAMHQRLYGNDSYCALVCSEALDYLQARRCGWIIPFPDEVIEGMQLSRARDGLPSLTAEEVADLKREVGVNFIVPGLTTAEEMLDVTQSILETNLYGIVGLDSYEGLMPNAEAQLDSIEDYPQQAARAMAISRFLQHYGPISRNKKHFTTFIMTCQVRTNRKKGEAQAHIQKYLKDWAETVPYAVKHWRTINMTVWSGGKINHKTKDEKTVLGKDVNWELGKGKLGTHDNIHGSTSYFYDARCFDIMHTVALAGIKYGLIRETSGSLTFFNEGEPHEYLCNIPSMDLFTQALAEDVNAEMELRYAILRAAGKDCLYV